MKNFFKFLYSYMPFKRSVFTLIRPILSLSPNIYRHFHFNGEISVKIDKTRKFKMQHYGHQIENDLFWAGFGKGFEATSLLTWVELAKAADSVFDIGSNTGVYALSAKTANPNAKVFAFDPIKKIFSKLQKNIELNNFDIEAVNMGVSNLTGEQSIFDTKSEHSYSASIGNKMFEGSDDLVEIKISTTSIDDFLSDKSVLQNSLIKIDTERHEVEVLQGFGDLIEEYQPTFLIEILDQEIGDVITEILHSDLYDYFRIDEGVAVEKIENFSKLDRDHNLGRNYIFLPKKRDYLSTKFASTQNA